MLSRVRALEPPPALTVIAPPLGSTRQQWAVIDLDISRNPVGTDRAVDLIVRCQNYGPPSSDPLAVTVIVDDVPVASRTLDFSGDEAAEVRISHRFRSAGPHR